MGRELFPKDTKALVKIAEGGGYDFALLRGVIEVNEQQYDRVAQKFSIQLDLTRKCFKYVFWA